MLNKPKICIISSLCTAILAIYHIYKLAIESVWINDQAIDDAAVHAKPFFILDASFWFWTMIAWISAFVLIRSYISLSEKVSS